MAPTIPSPPSTTATTTSRLQQARAVVTREAIVDAAIVEFADAGYRAASLAAIVERSRVTKGALYFHFSSKKELAAAVIEEMEGVCRRATDEVFAASVDPLRRLAVLARLMVRTHDDGPVLTAGRRLCAAGMGGPDREGMPWTHWQRVVGELFVRARDEGLLRADVDPGEAGRLLVDTSSGALTMSLLAAAPESLADRIRSHWDMLFGVVATDAWLSRWRAEGGMAAVLEPGPAGGPGGG